MKSLSLYVPRPHFVKKQVQKDQMKKKTHASYDKINLAQILDQRPSSKPKSQPKNHQNSLHINFPKSTNSSNKNATKHPYHSQKKMQSDKQIESKKEKAYQTRYDLYTKVYTNIDKNLHYRSVDKSLNNNDSSKRHLSKSYLINYLKDKNFKSKSQSKPHHQKSQRKLTNPIETEEHHSQFLMQFSMRTKQGVLISNPQKTNQDSLLIKVNMHDRGINLFAVADGHGAQGHFVSQYAIKSLENHVFHQLKDKNSMETIFESTFEKIQNQLYKIKDFNSNFSGSTLISVLIDKNYKLTCANVGDSRAILARQSKIAFKVVDKKNWEIIHLSQDHKPSLQKEKKRILKKGGRIASFKDEFGKSIGPQRVWLPNQNIQGLAMSRSLGDNISKPVGVTHQPEVISMQIQDNDKFILIASDGVWQFIKNFEILQLIVPFYKQNKLQQCSDALLKLAYERWTVEDTNVIDDITFILIFLNKSTK